MKLQTVDLRIAAANYRPAGREWLFSCDFEPTEQAASAGVSAVCVARPAAGQRWDDATLFWAAALFNCLEDRFLESDYEAISSVASLFPISDDLFERICIWATTDSALGSLRPLSPSQVWCTTVTAQCIAFLVNDSVGLVFFMLLAEEPDGGICLPSNLTLPLAGTAGL